MSKPFERNAETAVSAALPLTSLARRATVLAGLVLTAVVWPLLTAAHVFGPFEAIDTILRWHAHGMVDEIPFFNMTSLALHVVTLIATAFVARSAAQTRRAWRSFPREARRVRGDERGLVLDERVAVARDDIAAVEVVTDRDEAFAVDVRSKSGARFRVPMGSEEAAHALATALAPAHDSSRVVFEGVAGSRASETAATTLAALAIFTVLAVAFFRVDDNPFGGLLGRSPFSGRQFDFAYWVLWCATFVGPVLASVVAAACARPIARRLRAGRVAVDATGIELGAARSRPRIAYADVESVEPRDTQVALALRDGRRVRLSFAADRPVVELDQFVARVRAGMAGAVVATHPSAESSGVRVALRAEERDESALDEVEERRDAPRAARRRAP